MKVGRLVINKELEFESNHGVMKVLTQHLPGKQQNSVRTARLWPSPLGTIQIQRPQCYH